MIAIMMENCMKKITFTLPFLLFVLIPWNFNAQQVTVESPKNSYFYVSSAFVSSSTINHETIDPYFSISDQIENHRTLRFDVGFTFMKNTSLEIGYLGNWMDTATKLVIDEDRIPIGITSMARIAMYSLVLTHNFNLYKNRVFISPGLGYAIGNYSELPEWPLTTPEDRIDFGHEISSRTSSTALTDGSGHFLVFKFGIEVAIFKKLSIFSNFYLHKGMKNILEKETMYTINQENGSHKITSDGSTQGIEIGIKFNFR